MQASRQAGRWAGRQEGRQEDRQAVRLADRQAERQESRKAGRNAGGQKCRWTDRLRYRKTDVQIYLQTNGNKDVQTYTDKHSDRWTVQKYWYRLKNRQMY